MMTYGYARVSSRDQNEARQMIALKDAGVPEENIYLDKESGKDFDRPAWKRLKRKLKKGDVLFIKSLDRMGRNYQDVQEQWRVLNKTKGVDIVILDMPLLDTRADKNLVGTLISDIVLQLLAFVAQTERENIKQRQAEGIAAAKARGVRFGRPRREIPPEFDAAYQAWLSGQIFVDEAGSRCNIPGSTFYNIANRRLQANHDTKIPMDRTCNPAPVPRERPEKPPKFDGVYHAWLAGGLTAKEAALLLDIPVGRFRAYVKEERNGTEVKSNG